MAVLHFAKSGAKNAPTLPLDAITRTFGIFGQRGTGKTNTAVVLAEEMASKGGHVVMLDPVGAHFGITRAGEKPGLPGIVLGGEHGDVPLEETAGHLVADLVVGQHWPVVVVDMKLLRKGARMRFLADFLEDVYFNNRRPLHVFFEEADQVLPQSPRGMDPTIGRVLGAAEDIVKLGRGRGLGATLVSQRFATVNKNVVEQVETLLLHRLIGPNDRKAAKGWIESNGDPAVTQRVLDSLASLERGEAQLYSPGWLRVLEKVRVKARRTFDSSATPEVGAEVSEPTKRAPVDLDELRSRMAETVERAKANDPRELQKRIAELEREVAQAREQSPTAEPERVLVPDREAVAWLSSVISEAEVAAQAVREAADELTAGVGTQADQLREAADRIVAAREAVAEDYATLATLPAGGLVRSNGGSPNRLEGARPAPGVTTSLKIGERETKVTEGVSRPQQKILDALAWFEAIGVQEPKRTVVAAVAGVSSRSSGYRANVSTLSGLGLIRYPSSGRLALTVDGRIAATEPAVMPTREDLHRAVMDMVSRPQADLLRVLIDAYPEPVSREDLAAAAGVSGASSGFRANVSTLSGFELVEYPLQGYVAAAELLFPATALAGRR